MLDDALLIDETLELDALLSELLLELLLLTTDELIDELLLDELSIEERDILEPEPPPVLPEPPPQAANRNVAATIPHRLRFNARALIPVKPMFITGILYPAITFNLYHLTRPPS